MYQTFSGLKININELSRIEKDLFWAGNGSNNYERNWQKRSSHVNLTTRYLLTLTNPRLYTRSRTAFRLGQP